jgi:hypothetical protein
MASQSSNCSASPAACWWNLISTGKNIDAGRLDSEIDCAHRGGAARSKAYL